jgi:hypothetical protein
MKANVPNGGLASSSSSSSSLKIKQINFVIIFPSC